MTYHPRHLKQSPTPRRPWSRQITAGLVAAGLLLAAATPAHAADITIPRGATLWGIAAHYCGSGTKYMDLATANGIKNPDRIYAGARLNVTCGTRPAPTTASRSNPARTTPAIANGAWVNPLPGGGRSSCYGPRSGGFHAGTDITAATGTPIRAAHSGTVAAIKYEAGGGGNYVVLNHGGGTFTAYMHLVRRTPLNVGQSVAAGQVVGNVGATGDATGPHLHFEVHVNGIWNKVNPAAFMRSHGLSVGC